MASISASEHTAAAMRVSGSNRPTATRSLQRTVDGDQQAGRKQPG